MNVAAITAAIRRQTAVDSTVGQVTDANILAIINEGIAVVSSMHRWPFLESSANVSVTAATASYTLASIDSTPGIGQVRAVVRTGKNRALINISFDDYLARVGNDPSSSTEATHYAITGTSLFLYPTPSTTAASAYIMHYYDIPVDLTTGSPLWSAQFHHILVDYGAYRLWEREEYFDESEKAYGRFTRTLKDMIRWYNTQTQDYPLIYGDGSGLVWDPRLHLDIW